MQKPSISLFKGLNTVVDPLRLGLGWMSRADNITVTGDGALTLRPGFAQASPHPRGTVFCTEDESRLYAAVSDELTRVHADMSLTGLGVSLRAQDASWAEQDGRVYVTSGTGAWIITEDDEVLPWRWDVPGTPALSARSGSLPPGTYQVCFTFVLADGRETGAGESASITLDGTQSIQVRDIPYAAGAQTAVYVASADSTEFQFAGLAQEEFVWADMPDTLGSDLMTARLDPLPAECSVIQLWRGSAYAAQYMPSQDQTVIWISRPLLPHLFDLGTSFFMVSGRVTAMAPAEAALVVCTASAVYEYTPQSMVMAAPYGVPPGTPWTKDPESKAVKLWTLRGLCDVAPFGNLTKGSLSVPPGKQAFACLVHRDGDTKFVASLAQGGAAFNPTSKENL